MQSESGSFPEWPLISLFKPLLYIALSDFVMCMYVGARGIITQVAIDVLEDRIQRIPTEDRNYSSSGLYQ